MKKTVLVFLALLLIVSLSLNTVFAATEKTKVTVLTWWLTGFEKYLNQMKQEFEAANPNIEIVLQNFDGNIQQSLTTRIASGDIPDLVNLNNETALTYFQQGVLEPIDLYLKSSDKYEYIDSLWKKTIFDGKFNYTFPWYASPQVLFMNNDIFRKAGLNPNKPPKTWEDMYNYGKIIKTKTGVHGFTLEFANIAWEEPLRLGEQVFKPDNSAAAFNTPKMAARLEYFRKLYQEEIMPRSFPDYEGARAMFVQGQIAMFPLGVSMYKHIKDEAPSLNFSVVPYPISPKGANRPHVSMMNFTLMKASKVKKEAILFAKFITGHHAQIEFSKNASILPSTKISLESDPFFTKSNDGAVLAQLLAAKTMKNADNLIVINPPKGASEIYAAVRDNFLAAIRGEKTVKEALDTAEKQANAIIKNNN
ncbi:MAG TPA: sugar ABC transporter substrate-binding protein [Bacillota bacterium]|nr:sugar ABC transporter substrate-binding protein [Bacillota bacterium]